MFQQSWETGEVLPWFRPCEAVPEMAVHIMTLLCLPKSKPAHERTVRADRQPSIE